MIDITGLDKGEVVAALYNAAKPKGLGYLIEAISHTDPMTLSEGQRWFNAHAGGYINYLKGCVIKTDVSSDSIDERLYDRDNGEGTAARAIDGIRRRFVDDEPSAWQYRQTDAIVVPVADDDTPSTFVPFTNPEVIPDPFAAAFGGGRSGGAGGGAGWDFGKEETPTDAQPTGNIFAEREEPSPTLQAERDDAPAAWSNETPAADTTTDTTSYSSNDTSASDTSTSDFGSSDIDSSNS